MLKNLVKILLTVTVLCLLSCKETTYIDPNIPFVNLRTKSVLVAANERCKTAAVDIEIYGDSNLSANKYIKTVSICKTSISVNDIATVADYNYNFTLKLSGVLPASAACKNGAIAVDIFSSFNNIKNETLFGRELICFDNALPTAQVVTSKSSIDIFSSASDIGRTTFKLTNESKTDVLIKNISSKNSYFIIEDNSCGGIIFADDSCDIFISYMPGSGTATGQITLEFENADDININLSGKSSTAQDGEVFIGNFTTPIYILADDYAEVGSEIITIKNTSSKDIKITDIRYTGDQFFTDNNNCADTVSSGSECEIKIGYIPLNIFEASVNAKIIIDFESHSSIITDIIGVNLSSYFGDISAPLFAVNNNMIIKSNDKSLPATADIIISNNSEKTYKFISSFLSNNKYFSVVKTNCNTLLPDEKCSVTVSYLAGESDIISSAMILKFDLLQLIVNITGVSNKPINNSYINKLHSSFKILDNSTFPKSVSVIKFTNENDSVLKIVALENSNSNFYYYNPCADILPKNECKIFAIFTPSELGSFEDNLTIKFDSGTEKIITTSVKVINDFTVKIISDNINPLGVGFKAITGNNSATAYDWSFGDGKLSSATEVSHQYLKPGRYPIKLTAKNNENKTATDRKIITLSDSLTADFSVTSNGKKIALNQSIYNSADGEVSLFWEFGDGGKSYEPNPVHAYQKPGRYKIKLTVKNSANSVLTVTKYISVF